MKKIVERGYNKIADWYHKDRLKTRGTSILLKKIKNKFPKKGRVLDAGCGTGYPVTKFFVGNNYKVIGVDISKKMLAIAKRNFPEAKFYKKDMTRVKFPDKYFDIIVSILVILHVPKKKHLRLFKKFHKILRDNGRILISLTIAKDEDYVNNWVQGVKMYWSDNTKETNLALIKKAGFKIIWKKELGAKKDRHLYVLAAKE